MRVTASCLVRVGGRVQGVGYRDACVQAARALGVTGWVRNRRDGQVEALLQGPVDALERMRDWMRRGPEFARVDELTVSDAPPGPACAAFERRPTE